MPDRVAPRRRAARKKASADVVEHILGEIFAGRLRPGDRIDLDEVAGALDVSRLPVREAVLILERDGILSTRYHRGVFVEPFDAESIMDEFEIFGVLSGMAVRRLSERQDQDTIEALGKLLEELRGLRPSDRQEIQEIVTQMMVLEHRAGGSRRLRAELRSRTGFLPYLFRFTTGRSLGATVDAHSAVLRAIVSGDGEAAAAHRLADLRDAGRDAVRELTRRGVLERS